MSWEYCKRTSQLLQAAYATAKRKMDVVQFAKELPTVVEVFNMSDFSERRGYERALQILVKEHYWRADLSYGNGSKLSIFFTDREAVEAAIVLKFPQAVAFQIMES